MEAHFVFTQMHKRPGKIPWFLDSVSTCNLSPVDTSSCHQDRRQNHVSLGYPRSVFNKNSTLKVTIGDVHLDDGSPRVVSVVSDDATYHFTMQHPEVLYAQSLDVPIMSIRFRQKLKKPRTQIYMDLNCKDPQARVLNYCYK